MKKYLGSAEMPDFAKYGTFEHLGHFGLNSGFRPPGWGEGLARPGQALPGPPGLARAWPEGPHPHHAATAANFLLEFLAVARLVSDRIASCTRGDLRRLGHGPASSV